MIAYLSGKILTKTEKELIVMVSDVGYAVFVPRSFLEKYNEGQNIQLHIHTHVREDELSLYGFATQEAWRLFKLLLTVSGVGPKSALEILNSPENQIKQAIAKKDSAWLTRIPGIGTKTAQRIIIDLHGKVAHEKFEEPLTTTPSQDDLIQALISLGYPRHHVVEGLKKIPAEISGEEAIIKYFLQHS